MMLSPLFAKIYGWNKSILYNLKVTRDPELKNLLPVIAKFYILTAWRLEVNKSDSREKS